MELLVRPMAGWRMYALPGEGGERERERRRKGELTLPLPVFQSYRDRLSFDHNKHELSACYVSDTDRMEETIHLDTCSPCPQGAQHLNNS